VYSVNGLPSCGWPCCATTSGERVSLGMTCETCGLQDLRLTKGEVEHFKGKGGMHQLVRLPQPVGVLPWDGKPWDCSSVGVASRLRPTHMTS
jgi:hypothetical protein